VPGGTGGERGREVHKAGKNETSFCHVGGGFFLGVGWGGGGLVGSGGVFGGLCEGGGRRRSKMAEINAIIIRQYEKREGLLKEK